MNLLNIGFIVVVVHAAGLYLTLLSFLAITLIDIFKHKKDF